MRRSLRYILRGKCALSGKERLAASKSALLINSLSPSAKVTICCQRFGASASITPESPYLGCEREETVTELHNCVLIFSCFVLLVLVGDVFFGTTFCTALAKSAAVGKGFSWDCDRNSFVEACQES